MPAAAAGTWAGEPANVSLLRPWEGESFPFSCLHMLNSTYGLQRHSQLQTFFYEWRKDVTSNLFTLLFYAMYV